MYRYRVLAQNEDIVVQLVLQIKLNVYAINVL